MEAPAQPEFAAVIVAAGQGMRAGQPVPKQFARWRGKPLVRHSAEALIAAGAGPVVVAIPEGVEAIAAGALADLPVRFATGGATRQASVGAALEALASAAPKFV
jgi:2-C-methyl-D-erythritol 4-phosphate cytidylyltransferase/2-C-methyl-D-erythritol 2,4-cyclodiphosphate synthase